MDRSGRTRCGRTKLLTNLRSQCPRGVPTADASENKASRANICVDKLGKEIQAKAIDVSSFGLNNGV